MKFLALLRGINVGGNRVIRMADLKACFEGLGFRDVSTFIASGNVVFEAPRQSLPTLTASIERALSERFGYDASVVVVPQSALAAAVEGAPKGFGRDPKAYRYDVIFLRAPLTPAEALRSVTVKEGVDEAHAGKQVLYFSRLEKKATQSRLPRLMGTPVYKRMTIRNWSTTTKLLALMEST